MTGAMWLIILLCFYNNWDPKTEFLDNLERNRIGVKKRFNQVHEFDDSDKVEDLNYEDFFEEVKLAEEEESMEEGESNEGDELMDVKNELVEVKYEPMKAVEPIEDEYNYPADNVEPPNDNSGEMGRPVTLPPDMSKEMAMEVAEGWQRHSFNEVISNLISVKRKLPDVRYKYCLESVNFQKELPHAGCIARG